MHRTPVRWVLPVLAVALLAAAHGSALSRTITVRPDGTGDVPTFQAGADSLVGDSEGDTLLVAPGRYDEDVRLGTCGGLILCPAGPQKTVVHGLSSSTLLAQPSPMLTIWGLGVETAAAMGVTNGPRNWSNCVFQAGLIESENLGYGRGVVDHCWMRGRSTLEGALIIEDCQFIQAPTTIGPWSFYDVAVRRCSFSGPVDTALVIHGGGDQGVSVESCVISNARIGVVASGNCAHGFSGCHWSDISEAAIDVPIGIRSFDIGGCRFERCGTGLRVSDGWLMGELRLSGDTFTDIAGDAILAAGHWVRIADVLVERAKGSGIVVAAPQEGWPYVSRGFSPEIEHCLVQDVGGDGIRLDGSVATSVPQGQRVVRCTVKRTGGFGILASGIGFNFSGNVVVGAGRSGIHVDQTLTDSDWLQTSIIIGSTVVGNAGSGLSFSSCSPATAYTFNVSNNLAVANGGAGIELQLPATALFGGNDCWLNSGAAYVGVTASDSNLIADPQFCDPIHEDFHVASTSPCAPDGPYGQIGALGVGCDRMRVAIDVHVPDGNGVDLTNGHGVVTATILGSRYFDAARVDERSVTYLGARATGLEGGGPKPRLRDVDGDGQLDRTMFFRRDDLQLGGTGAGDDLLGMTRDGVPFVGNETPGRVRGGKGPAKLASDGPMTAPVQLGIRSVTPNPATSLALSVQVALPTAEPATLELVDVSGRRVLQRALNPGGGVRVVRLDERGVAPSGLYWLRLTQAGRSVTSRVAVVR